MLNRADLQEVLEDVLGSPNVYFQPPESIKLQYPCIIYKRNSGDTKYADNMPYNFMFSYNVTFISKNPDNEILHKLIKLPMCRFDTHFTKDNLNHDIFTLFY